MCVELDVTKHAVAFMGVGEPSLGYRCQRVDDVGKTLCARADYA